MNYKRISFIALAVLCTFIGVSFGQIELPSPSPTASFSQKVGLTEVSINYSRPSKKGRTIFGDLVPYGKLWRTGANSATRITFSDDVKIAGKDLPAGSYALFTIPGEDEWTIIFNKNHNQSGTGNYKESEDAIRVTIKPIIIPATIETLLINLENLKPESAIIEILWESTVVQIPLEVSVDERIMASIDKAMKISPNTYYSAAIYYRDSGKDLNQALEWMNKAVKIHEAEGRNAFWVYRQKSLLEAEMKKYSDAVATAKVSLEKAKEAGNDDYVKMNTESIAEWSKK